MVKMMFPETKAAWKRLKFNFRAMICEDAIGFAYWICPKGYTPTPSKMLADEIRYHTVERQWREEQCRATSV